MKWSMRRLLIGCGLDGIVAVVRVDGCWRSVWTSNVLLSSLSMAALKLMNDVMVEMHRDSASPHVGFSGPKCSLLSYSDMKLFQSLF